MVQKTTYADDEGLDFIDSLPTPEIKNTQELIAAATPAVEVAAPIVETPIGSRRGDVQPASTGPSFSEVRKGIIDTAKPNAILAYEQQFGTTMEPIYAKGDAGGGRGGNNIVDYGAPIGYRFDNGKSQYVNFDASGEYQGTATRGDGGAFANIALSIISVAYPPIAPFIQAYKAIEAIDKGDTLGFILNAAGAGKSIPGLDASTTKLLSDVSTGAKVIKAVETGDPLKILSAAANIRGVDPDLKDLSIVVNTAKAINDGNIAGAINGISKMSDRDSIGRLTDRFDDIVSSSNSGGGDDAAPIDNTEGGSGGPTLEEQAAQEQEDREQAAREAARASEKTIEDKLTDAGLVSDTQDLASQEAERIAQEQEDREQAARDAVRASEKTIEDQLVDSGLVLKTDAEEKLKGVEVTGKALTDTDLPITDDKSRNIVTDSGLPITSDTGGNRVTDSNLPVNPNVGTIDPTLAPVTVTTKALQDDLDITSSTGTNRVTDSSVLVNPNVGTTDASLAPVTVTTKALQDDLLPLEVMPPLPSSKVTPVIAGAPVLPTLPNLSATTATKTTSARKPTPSQAQRLADAFAVPTLANTFYGNADFSTKKVEVDDEGNIIEVPYEPIDVSKPASKSLLANGGQITDNSTNHLVALLNHIMGSQDRNQLTEDDLLDIVRKGI